MSDWLIAMVPLFKAAHIGALIIWCGALITLPLMLAQHRADSDVNDYQRLRNATHTTYTFCATPAAVATIVIGTWLIFLRDVHVPWLYLKLLFVAFLVGAHAWIGHLVVKVADTEGLHRPPPAWLSLIAILVPIVCILGIVLAKPDLSNIEFPQWLSEPRGGQLPFEAPSL